jgi:hypothetical protein
MGRSSQCVRRARPQPLDTAHVRIGVNWNPLDRRISSIGFGNGKLVRYLKTGGCALEIANERRTTADLFIAAVQAILLLCCFVAPSPARGQSHFSFPPPFRSDSVELEPVVLKEVLGLLCPGHERIGKESGCDVCPEGSSSAGENGDLIVQTALFGHFLAPDSDDLLVGTYGCETHVTSTHGNLVFTRRTGVWSIGRKYCREWSVNAVRSATAVGWTVSCA